MLFLEFHGELHLPVGHEEMRAVQADLTWISLCVRPCSWAREAEQMGRIGDI